MKKTSAQSRLAAMLSFGLMNNSAVNGGGGFDPLVLLLLALVIEAYFGRLSFLFRFIPHPVAVIGGAIGWCDRKLNRDKRSNMDRALRGAVSVLVIIIIAGAIGWGVAWLTFNHQFGWVVELFLLLSLLSGRDLFDRVRDVMGALKKDGMEAAREKVSHIVGRDPAYLDEHGIARASIESLAENFSDAVVAPVFWYVLFGFPGVLIYKAANTMDSCIGYTTPRHRAFGMAAARLDDILNLAPARLSGLIIVLAAFVAPKANPLSALKTMWKDASKHASPNAGWPEGAMAGALGLALSGPRKYPSQTVNAPWIGSGRAAANADDIKRALYMYVVAMLINALMVAVIAVFRFGL